MTWYILIYLCKPWEVTLDGRLRTVKSACAQEQPSESGMGGPGPQTCLLASDITMWSFSLSCCLLFTKKTNEKNVFLFINVTQYRKSVEKNGTFLKCKSWIPATLHLFPPKEDAGVNCWKGHTSLGWSVWVLHWSHLPHTGACWWVTLGEWAKNHPTWSLWHSCLQNLMKPQRQHLPLVPGCSHSALFRTAAHMFPMNVNYEKLSGPFNHSNGL